MEIPETISDAGTAYIQDIRNVIPISALATGVLAMSLSLTRSANDTTECGLWLIAATTPIATLLKADGGIWAYLHILDLPIALICAGLALLISGIFRRIVFWALTSSEKFKNLEHSQKSEAIDDIEVAKQRTNWINEQISKTLPNLKKKDTCAELLCGVVATSFFYGQLSVNLDLVIFFAALIASYICVQSSAKDYLSKVYPFVLLKANLAGFRYIEPKR